MANKRMINASIVETDLFVDMPLSAQCLYFHLNVNADDDGFVGSPKRIQRSIGASDDDLKLLIAKGFIIVFQSGVIVITHWKMHNTIKKDRYTETIYTDELNQLGSSENKAYKLIGDNMETIRNQNGTKTDPKCLQNGTTDKNRLDKNRLDKNRLEESEKKRKSNRFAPPSVDDVRAYCNERHNNVDPERFVYYYESNGWKVGKNKMKDWKATVRSWEHNDYSNNKKQNGSIIHEVPMPAYCAEKDNYTKPSDEPPWKGVERQYNADKMMLIDGMISGDEFRSREANLKAMYKDLTGKELE